MDREEFTRAVLEYENTLYRVAKSMLGSEADCADAAQNALLRAWERLHTLRDPAYFKTWLTRILINECRAILRQRARYSPLEAEIAEDEAAPEGETVQPDAGGFRLKHLDAEYTVDRDKVVELAQKGLDYDRVRSKLETAREELTGLKAEAERAGVDVTALPGRGAPGRRAGRPGRTRRLP